MRDLATLALGEGNANVHLLGQPGVGETMLAVRLSIVTCQAGYSVHVTVLDDVVRNLREAERAGRFAKKLKTYLKPSVLVLDEFGYLLLSIAEGNMAFQLVSRRCDRGSTILTSNKTFAELGQVFGDEVLASAILDRLVRHAEVISINGPSYGPEDRTLEQREGGDGRPELKPYAPALIGHGSSHG